MGKVIVEQIISADGYAEGANGSIDFFVNANWINEVDGEQPRVSSDVAAIVFGAKTYRMFADYWPSADRAAEPVAIPIRELPKFVVPPRSNRPPGSEGLGRNLTRRRHICDPQLAPADSQAT